jgi:hypothetical protein
MKLTESRLRKIIKEEIQKLNEKYDLDYKPPKPKADILKSLKVKNPDTEVFDTFMDGWNNKRHGYTNVDKNWAWQLGWHYKGLQRTEHRGNKFDIAQSRKNVNSIKLKLNKTR